MNPLRIATLLAFALPAAASAQPRLVLPRAEHDFGAADNARTIEHVFEIRNEGDAPLPIGRLRACCGGTAEISASEIPPGSNAWLTVTLALRGRSGPQRKSYYISTGDPATPYAQVRLVGTAVAAVDIRPRWLNFPAAGGDQSVTSAVTVVTQSDWRFDIVGASCDSPFFKWTVARTGEDRHEIAVRTVPPVPPGATRATLKLETDRAEHPEIRILLVANVPSDLFVVPSEILLAETDTPATRFIAVRSRKNRPFRILETDATDPGLDIAVSELPGGYRIEVRNLLAHRDIEPQQILLTTDREDARHVAVPVRIVDPPNERKPQQ